MKNCDIPKNPLPVLLCSKRKMKIMFIVIKCIRLLNLLNISQLFSGFNSVKSLTQSCLICIPLSLVSRVERLWRDVWSVTCQYYNLLHSLEEEGFIDLSNAVHLVCVGYVFIPRLRADLQHFTESWNCHPLRTEGNLSPNQLWNIGMLQAPVPEPDLSEVFIQYYTLI